MAKYDWKNVTREHVIKAIEQFLEEQPEYPSPRSTFLVYDGKKLPAKHIRGIAYKIAYNKEISKDDYAGGLETVRFFENLGFEMYYTGNATHKTSNVKADKTEINQISPTKQEMPIKQEETVVIDINDNEQKPSIEKIKISSKQVIEQKNALQLILNKMFDGDIVSEKTYPWLKTPSIIEGQYKNLYEALHSYRGDDNFAKSNVVLRCDFVCESQKLIIEYDERQHFSEARRVSLEAYKELPVAYDRDLWIRACEDIQAKDNQPINRDEIRAYYDSTRDIEAQLHGYKLVRIMHGQIDFEKEDASDKLELLLSEESYDISKLSKLKIVMYLQTEEHKNKNDFDKAMKLVSESEADIMVFPEFGWVPFWQMIDESDVANEDDVNSIYDECITLSKQIDKALIISSCDKYGTIFSVFANANATEEETECSMYVKHTMTQYSAFEFNPYSAIAPTLFAPIIFRDHWIGMTICYDCNHALFSRMYGVQDVDIIINSTGGNVVYDKWYKYNQSRAIENHCYTFVTMGGDGEKDKVNSYVYGFTPNGKEMHPRLLNGTSEMTNIPGGIYIYDTAQDDGTSEAEKSLNQNKSFNKFEDFNIPVGNVDSILSKAKEVEKNLLVYKQGDVNIIFVITENDDIFKAEKFLPLMYSDKLQKIPNRRYVLVCKYKDLEKDKYENSLSIVLKVRAMENFCAVVLESDLVNNCYQAGKSRTAQVLEQKNGLYGLELSRMTGPEAIWKNKGDTFKATWRENFVWLANKCKYIAENDKWD